MSWFPSLRAIGGTRGTGPRSKAGPLTLVDLKSGTSRLIESFPYDYGKILASSDVVNGLLSAPLTVEEKSKNVIIVGCGMSGLLAARELLRAGLTVKMYDRGILATENADWTHYHYGRACSDIRKFAAQAVVCELGGMRFAEKAKATWQFFSEAFEDTQTFESFPNPGIVPTALLDHEKSYLWQAGSIEHPDLPPQFQRISDDVIRAMNGITDSDGTTTIDVQPLLGKDVLSPIEEAQLSTFWTYVVTQFDNMTFGAWVHEFVEVPNNWTQDDLATFFNLGFGTGGMGSLFSVGFLEMYRIWIWDYANEYALPVGVGLGSIANTVLEKLKTRYGLGGTGTLTVFEQHEVQGIGYLAEDAPIEPSEQRPAILVCDLVTGRNSLEIDDADYLIAAVPHTALIPMASFTTNRSYPRNSTRHSVVGGNGGSYFYQSYFGKKAPSVATTKMIRPLKNAISKLNMVNSSKSFYAFENPPWESPLFNWATIDAIPVQCVLHDGWPRASYLIPATDQATGPVVGLFSYAWNLDSNKVRAIKDVARTYEFENDPAGAGATERAAWFGPGYSDEWWRAYRTASTVIPGALVTGGDPTAAGTVTEFFGSIADGVQNSDATGIDWQDVAGLSGGFKLDAAGDFQTSNALSYSYLLVLDSELSSDSDARVYQRIYFASDSASNYGGWVEGALMAGTNAVVAILTHINQSKLKPEPASLLRGNPFSSINSLIPLKPYEPWSS
jgi:hypothetical protein